MFKRPVTALLPDQPPTICFQAANDVANLHALAYRISVETYQRQREFLLRTPFRKGDVIIEGVPQEDLERRLSVNP